MDGCNQEKRKRLVLYPPLCGCHRIIVTMKPNRRKLTHMIIPVTVISRDQLSLKYGIGRQNIQFWINRYPDFPHYLVGGHLFLEPSEVFNWIEQRSLTRKLKPKTLEALGNFRRNHEPKTSEQ